MKNLLSKINTTARLYVSSDFIVDVTILDVRQAFGRIDYEVTPVAGAGAKWVSADKITEAK